MTATRARATLLVNPAAHDVPRKFDADRAVRYLRKRGVDVRLEVPGSPTEMTRQAAASAERGDDLLFVAGGDGSLRVAAGGLAGSGTALAPIPVGTVNIFARETGVPFSVRRAIDAHLDGRRARIDLGRADGEPFLLMASAGWDARVVREVPLGLKRRLGDLAYIAKAAVLAPRLRPHRVRLMIGERWHDEPLAIVVVSNTRLYGGRVQLTPLALADDGLLDVLALCPRNPIEALRLACKAALRMAADDPRALTGRVREVCVETPGVPVQLDGDYAGETPRRFTVEPAALLVSVPAGVRPAILSAGDA